MDNFDRNGPYPIWEGALYEPFFATNADYTYRGFVYDVTTEPEDHEIVFETFYHSEETRNGVRAIINIAEDELIEGDEEFTVRFEINYTDPDSYIQTYYLEYQLIIRDKTVIPVEILMFDGAINAEQRQLILNFENYRSTLVGIDNGINHISSEIEAFNENLLRTNNQLDQDTANLDAALADLFLLSADSLTMLYTNRLTGLISTTISLANDVIQIAKSGVDLKQSFSEGASSVMSNTADFSADLIGLLSNNYTVAYNARKALVGFLELQVLTEFVETDINRINYLENTITQYSAQLESYENASELISNQVDDQQSENRSLATGERANDSNISSSLGNVNFTEIHETIYSLSEEKEVVFTNNDNDHYIDIQSENNFSLLDLGSGYDQISVNLVGSSVTISHVEDYIVITHYNGQIIASGLEKIVLSDNQVVFGNDTAEAQVYRLYQAAFDRVPDIVGLSHNGELVSNGMSIFDMSNAFILSTEFQETYGVDVSDIIFLTLLYQNVLKRAPDPGGLSGWQDQMDDGVSREQVLFGFSESPENKANVASAIDDGIWLV